MEFRKLHPEFFVCQMADVPANILRREDGWRKRRFDFLPCLLIIRTMCW